MEEEKYNDMKEYLKLKKLNEEDKSREMVEEIYEEMLKKIVDDEEKKE